VSGFRRFDPISYRCSVRTNSEGPLVRCRVPLGNLNTRVRGNWPKIDRDGCLTGASGRLLENDIWMKIDRKGDRSQSGS
jgi:hypothetical protein